MNFFCLVIAAWQAWEARDIESEFSEGKYIGLSVFSLCQAFMTGIPIIAVVKDIPEAFYLVTVFLVFIVCMVVLSLVFVPKIRIQTLYAKLTVSEQRKLLAISVRRSAFNSAGESSELSSRRISGLALPANHPHHHNRVYEAFTPLTGSSRTGGSDQLQPCEHCGCIPAVHGSSNFQRRSNDKKKRYSVQQERKLGQSIQGFLGTGSLRLPSSDESFKNTSSAVSPESAIVSDGGSSGLYTAENGAPTIPEENEGNESNDDSVVVPEGQNASDQENATNDCDTQQTKNETQDSSVVEA